MASKLDLLTITDKGKLHALLHVQIVASHLVIVGAESIVILANRVRQINTQTRFMVDHDT